jgi:hypothetical protein
VSLERWEFVIDDGTNVLAKMGLEGVSRFAYRGHVAGKGNKRPIDEQEAAICRALGRRLAAIGLRLRQP